MFFFFFQAEDGIRDTSVTGVQTCALPICFQGPPPKLAPNSRFNENFASTGVVLGVAALPDLDGDGVPDLVATRSEERRVGKECSSGWSRYYEKKKIVGVEGH